MSSATIPRAVCLSLLAACSSVPLSCAAQAPDNDFRETKLSKVAFGSCSKPFWPQPLWRTIREQEPQVYASACFLLVEG
eukprot:357319-Hanusia_phi.AAC.10